MSTRGKPSDLSPASVARALGLKVPGGMVEWVEVEKYAYARYWELRSEVVLPGRVPWWNFPHLDPL